MLQLELCAQEVPLDTPWHLHVKYVVHAKRVGSRYASNAKTKPDREPQR
jgi:hypothetical protein